MPLYEYVCESCQNDFEKLVRLSDPVPPCPECGAEDVKKKISASAFSLKGGGWYKDGYSGPSNQGGGSGGSAGGSSGGES